MPKIDEFYLISGLPFEYEGYTLVPPSLEVIRDEKQCGYNKYLSYLFPFCITKQDIIKQMELEEWYNSLAEDVKKQLTVFNLLLFINDELFINALQFFIEERVVYDRKQSRFLLYKNKKRKPVAEINKDNFTDLCQGVCQLNYRSYTEPEDVDKYSFRSAKAKEKYKRFLKEREKFNEIKSKSDKNNDSFELGNVIASLSAKSPTYNLCNIYNLTVYQLYDQFYKTIKNNQVDTYAHKWASWGTDDFDFTIWFKKQF